MSIPVSHPGRIHASSNSCVTCGHTQGDVDPESVTPDDPLAYALNKMFVGGFRNVPVINDEMYPIGVISISDIISTIADYFHNEIINLP